MPMKTRPALLAFAATATAVCLSILAGWQRGGWMVERALWIAVGVVLVVAAHLLPALCRPHGWRLRIVGAALWLACMAATCYGHAVFFLMAQKHAGELRAAAVPVVGTTGRDLTTIAADRAGVVARLARVSERRCSNQCAGIRIERTGLAARLDALDVEMAEAKRAESASDRADAAHDAALADPVTGALTAFGLPAPRADLIAGLAFAAVLEAVACFAWLLALAPAAVPEIAVTPALQASNAEPVTVVTTVSNGTAPVESVAAGQLDDAARVATAIATGEIRSTVAAIRKFLGCSQATAQAVRKRVRQADT
ncbi:hypothetical protein [Paraburkholderia sp. Cpub6]|uniref:hypothetical protein n=1 Tax=Paraburkholderia sp. Cpub6 TaxID=2723094 RepID=UPI001614FE04|nr:hypothetical protein [Paraburkholderia sp. Cpub6]MBB5462917.1 hypothetical protein [Paraburkholderia sp. Cpub6]